MGHEASQEVPKSRSSPVFYSSMDDLCDIANGLGPAKNKLVTPFIHGVWSTLQTSKVAPPPRVGHFTCCDHEGANVYVGYGSNPDNGETYSDVWRLDLARMEFEELDIANPLPHRNGSRAIFVDSKIMVFGGFAGKSYFADLHYIDLKTNEVHKLVTRGEGPSPRSTPVMGYNKDKLVVWSGFNGRYPRDLHVLSWKTLEWRTVKTNVTGRTGAAFAQVGNRVMVFGGSTEGMFIIDIDKEVVVHAKTQGREPPPKVLGGGMVRVRDFLMFCGGKTSMEGTSVYGLDLKKMAWFEFDVRPDSESVYLNDGYVSEEGTFMLPGVHSFSMAYSKKRREVVWFFGSPIQTMTPVNVIAVGDALSNFHIQSDMLSMLSD